MHSKADGLHLIPLDMNHKANHQVNLPPQAVLQSLHPSGLAPSFDGILQAVQLSAKPKR
jgi:hypothetical protein